MHISVPFLIHISGTTNLTAFTVSLKSVDAVVVGRSEAEKNAGGGIDECMLSAARTKACMKRWSFSAWSHAFFTEAYSL